MSRDISDVRILCSPEDKAKARAILAAWPAEHELPFGLGIEDGGERLAIECGREFRRLTVTDGHAYGYMLLSSDQWETLREWSGPAEHLARVLAHYAKAGKG